MPNILFRADAEDSIGTGDLISLIYLSRQFRQKGWNCFFAVRDYPPASIIINKYKLSNIFLIPQSMPIVEEITIIKKLCQDEHIDCLFMQITKRSLSSYKTLGKPAPIKVCVNFDGIIDSDFDIVINWCVESGSDLYSAYRASAVKFMLGFPVTILPDYLDWAKIAERVYPKDIKKIFISMGGVDKFNLTQRIVEALSSESEQFRITVAIGPGYAFKRNLLDYMRNHYGCFSVRDNADNLFDDYIESDLAFSAGGLTSSELVATKTPAVLIASYQHQVGRCNYFARSELAYYAGFYDKVDTQRIVYCLEYMKKNISKYRYNLQNTDFRGGNEEIFNSISYCR